MIAHFPIKLFNSLSQNTIKEGKLTFFFLIQTEKEMNSVYMDVYWSHPSLSEENLKIFICLEIYKMTN